jgi:hypothetical protein
MPMNFKDAPPQAGGGDVVPPGLYKLRINLRPGGAGDDGLLKDSKSFTSQYLDFKFDIISGSYAGKRLFETWVVAANEMTDNMKTAVGISHARIRATLESAHGYETEDKSDEATKACTIDSYSELNGLEIVARLGVKKQDGYADKNIIQEIVTPSDKAWHGFMSTHPRVTGKGKVLPKPLRDAMDDEIPF